ncbi:MAG: NAD-dependent protein deacylase, partial [Aquificaceae bacterium]|nr:NAD-dependent protein deacylase [Aquificaceae bacterium]MDW8237835.1 NAD-dependent protein deacylase [Aquificaceae bacterium]
ALKTAIESSQSCDIFVSIGTSALVYPAASLPFIAKENGAKLIEINPQETPISKIADIKIREKASLGVEKLVKILEV